LQQLILEYEDPVTCFVNEGGIAEPLIAIWGPEALERLKGVLERGKSGLDGVVEGMGGKLVKPLREEWIQWSNTEEQEGL
jgi:molybdopterin-guanine dinucleotide biosynthesis protein A